MPGMYTSTKKTAAGFTEVNSYYCGLFYAFKNLLNHYFFGNHIVTITNIYNIKTGVFICEV